MKLHRSRTFAEHKLVARVRNALLALLLLPLVGIVVGAVVWWDLERGFSRGLILVQASVHA